MKFRIFTPADATVAALFLLVLTLVAISGFLSTDGGPGFAVPVRPRPRERLGEAMSPSLQDVRVNPNHADANLLATVPGIGPRLADAIVRFRKDHGPFQHLAELGDVPGIGSHRLEKMAPHLTLAEDAAWSTR
jgi:competence protein ComEA